MGFGESLSLLSAFAWAIAVIQFRRVGEHLPAIHLNVIKTILVAILLIPTLFLFEPFSWPDIDSKSIWIAAISGVLGIGLADTAYFAALNRLGPGRMAVFGSLYTPIVIVLAATYLGERLNGLQWAGVGLVLVGVALVSIPENGKMLPVKEIFIGGVLAIGAPLLMAIAVIIVKPVLETQSFFWVVEIRMLGALISLAPLFLSGKLRREFRASIKNPKVPWRYVFSASFLGTYLALILWLAGYKYADATIAAVLNETATLWIILFAWLMLKEKPTGRKLAGAMLAVVGATSAALLG